MIQDPGSQTVRGNREFAQRKQLELGARIDTINYRRTENLISKPNVPVYLPLTKDGITTSNTDHKSRFDPRSTLLNILKNLMMY